MRFQFVFSVKMSIRIGEDSHSGILGIFLLYLVPNFYKKKPLPI